jgi:O-antigen/teichoic acid export membrane protein
MPAPPGGVDVTDTPTPEAPIRGSTLLLGGLVFAAGVDFVAQVILVRYLSKADFGAWSYALAVIALLSMIAQLELGNTVARFLPIYAERGQLGRMRGAITLSLLIVTGFGVALALALVVAIAVLGLRPIDDPTALRVLLITAIVVAVLALDTLLTGLFAAFGASRTIFVRHSVLGPGLRLAVVLLLIATGAGVEFLAVAYVSVSLIGLALYAANLPRVVRHNAQPAGEPAVTPEFPTRELLRFAAPLLASTVVWILMDSSDALLLGYFFDAEAVANYRIVSPLARMNLFAFWAFTTLFIPSAARAFARSDTAELGRLYWQTALWMTVLTFPIFLLTSSFASVIVPSAYGSAYAGSAPILALLSIGFFVNTALGFNALTVRVHHRLRYLVGVDLSMAVLNIVVNLALIPRFGPIGAAVGTAGTIVVHTLLKHIGLWRFTGVPVFPRDYLPIYAGLAAIAAALYLVNAAFSVNLPVALVLAGFGALAAIALARGSLMIDVLFPELAGIPLLRRLTGARQ